MNAEAEKGMSGQSEGNAEQKQNAAGCCTVENTGCCQVRVQVTCCGSGCSCCCC